MNAERTSREVPVAHRLAQAIAELIAAAAEAAAERAASAVRVAVAAAEATPAVEPERILLNAREAAKALGVSTGTLGDRSPGWLKRPGSSSLS